MTRRTLADTSDTEARADRHLMNDLVSVLGLPAMWSDADAPEIARTLIEALRSVLALDLVFAAVDAAGLGSSADAALISPRLGISADAAAVRDTLHSLLGAARDRWPATTRRRVGADDVALAVFPLGIGRDLGLVVAGACRADFPNAREALLLKICANQAAVALHESRLRDEQKRVAARLERQVAERTRELTEANASLVREVAERRRVEQAMSEAAARAQAILDGIPGMTVVLHADGSVDAASKQNLAYLGVTIEELRQWGMNGIVHPADVPGLVAVFRPAIAAGRAFHSEQRLRRHDGVYRWFEGRLVPVLDPDGRVARWYVLLTDIDDRKLAEQAVAESEKRLRDTVDSIPAHAWSAHPNGDGDFFNRHFLDFVGLTIEQARGWGWAVAVHPDDLPALTSAWQRILVSGEPGEAEARLRRHDGVYHWFLIRMNPLHDDTGAVVKWYGLNTDIEDRKQAEGALRESEAFLLEVQRLSRTGGWRYDVATDIIESSAEIQRWYGIQPGEDIMRPPFWFERIHHEDRPRVQAEFERCMREKSNYEAGYRIVLPDGSIRYQHATGHAVVDEHGALAGFMGASRDMTDQWRASAELERASEALRQLQAELARAAQVTTVAELAASIAHEVNQPLSGIITNASTCLRMLVADPPNVDGARETAKRALRDGGRAADVIERLRALFSKKDFALESLDLNEAMREVVAVSAADLQRNRVALELDLADDLPTVMGDRVQLQQVMLNLLRNASDAMADVHDRPRKLSIRTERATDALLRVAVRDTGTGVDAHSADKLFNAFYTTKRDGMGIGLSVSRSIVERHGGRLWVEPSAGPGATFVFTIPAETAPPAAPATAGERRL